MRKAIMDSGVSIRNLSNGSTVITPNQFNRFVWFYGDAEMVSDSIIDITKLTIDEEFDDEFEVNLHNAMSRIRAYVTDFYSSTRGLVKLNVIMPEPEDQMQLLTAELISSCAMTHVPLTIWGCATGEWEGWDILYGEDFSGR